jgi:hypothetical protein
MIDQTIRDNRPKANRNRPANTSRRSRRFLQRFRAIGLEQKLHPAKGEVVQVQAE